MLARLGLVSEIVAHGSSSDTPLDLRIVGHGWKTIVVSREDTREKRWLCMAHEPLFCAALVLAWASLPRCPTILRNPILVIGFEE